MVSKSNNADMSTLKKEIAGAFVYTRSTCDDERELLALSQRYKASGKDRCHTEFLRDSVIVTRYASTSKADFIGKDGVVSDEVKLLTEKWVQLFKQRFRLPARNNATRTRKRKAEPPTHTAKALRLMQSRRQLLQHRQHQIQQSQRMHHRHQFQLIHRKSM